MANAYLGIDVGWSRRRPSCGIAWSGLGAALPGLPDGDATLGTAHVRLDDLLHLLKTITRVPASKRSYDELVVVIDGPVSRSGLASARRRHVDEACTQTPFSRRAQSALLTGPFGEAFVDATNRIVKALDASAGATGGAGTADRGFRIRETNPTVAMAVALPQQAEDTLPSRRRARYLEGFGAIRAKSDWYWHLGASELAASMLGDPRVTLRRQHEETAALFCLALAVALGGDSRDGSGVVAIGDAQGTYLLPARIHDSWRDPVQEVGLFEGEFTGSGVGALNTSEAALQLPFVDVADSRSEVHDEHDTSLAMMLTDNGGLHASANAWLATCSFPCHLTTTTEPPRRVTVHARTHPAAPYCVEPTALTLAREVAGFRGDALSAAPEVAISVLPVGPDDADAGGRPT